MADIPKDTTPRDQAWADALFNRYETKAAGQLNFQWKQDIAKAIKKDFFKCFVSAHIEAKQFIIVSLTKAGYKVKVSNIGCSVVSITIDKAGE